MGSLSHEVHRRHDITFEEDVGAARRATGVLAAGLTDVRRGDVELAVTELATNILRHAPAGGYLLTRRTSGGIELLAVDRGSTPTREDPQRRGIAAWSVSAPRGLGAGLACVARLSSVFDVYSGTGGTVVLSQLGAADARRTEWCRWGAVNVPVGGETESGDAWDVAVTSGGRVSAVIADGLGHGPEAAIASRAALTAFDVEPAAAPDELLRRTHETMRGTRGGTVGFATIDAQRGEVAFSGVGNVTGRIVRDGAATRHLVTRDGTLGIHAQPPLPGVARYEWLPHDALVLTTDGVRSRWDLEPYPGLLDHDPAVVAAVVQRDHARGKDDVAVLVIRDVRSAA
jgi:anti-sigma regulatory factor (Ser/Thr protein kinase)